MESSILRLIITLVSTLLFGIYFSYTDITRRIIPNRILTIFLLLSVALNVLFIIGNLQVTKDILLSFGLAIVLGLSAYYLNLWHAGDGKLFIIVTFIIIPFTDKPLLLSVFNFCLSIGLCYCLLFPFRLVDSIIKKKMGLIIMKTARTLFSVERLCQAIFAYALSLIIPLNIDVTIRTVMIYLVFYLIQSRLKRYFAGRIKIWHIYAVLAIGLLVFIRITNYAFPLINLLYLFGFIFLITFYFTMNFFSYLVFLTPDELKPGMGLAYSMYEAGGKIIASPFGRNDAGIIMKAPKELAESDINYLKEKEQEQKRLRIPIRGTARPIPFAPFIIASTLFILLKLLLQQLR